MSAYWAHSGFIVGHCTVHLEVCLEISFCSCKQTSIEKICDSVLACIQTDHEAKTPTGTLFLNVILNWQPSCALQKICWISRHRCQPLGITIRAARCGTLTQSFLWHNKMAKGPSQTCRICLILIFSTCPVSSNARPKTKVFHNSTNCSREMIHDHVSSESP